MRIDPLILGLEKKAVLDDAFNKIQEIANEEGLMDYIERKNEVAYKFLVDQIEMFARNQKLSMSKKQKNWIDKLYRDYIEKGRP